MAPDSRSVIAQWQEFVRHEFRKRYPNNDGDRKGPIRFNRFRDRTLAEYPEYQAELELALSTLVHYQYVLTLFNDWCFPALSRGIPIRTVTRFHRMIKASSRTLSQRIRIYEP